MLLARSECLLAIAKALLRVAFCMHLSLTRWSGGTLPGRRMRCTGNGASQYLHDNYYKEEMLRTAWIAKDSRAFALERLINTKLEILRARIFCYVLLTGADCPPQTQQKQKRRSGVKDSYVQVVLATAIGYQPNRQTRTRRQASRLTPPLPQQ